MAVDHGHYAFSAGDLDTDAELSLIRLLDFFNMVGHNWKQGVLMLADIIPTTIGYAAVRVHRDAAVQSYLAQIAAWDEERYRPGTGFGYFRQLATELESACTRPPRRTLAHRLRQAFPAGR